MASARELLEQADALMRRNRAGMIDTEIPELREVIAMVALAPAAPVPAAARRRARAHRGRRGDRDRVDRRVAGGHRRVVRLAASRSRRIERRRRPGPDSMLGRPPRPARYRGRRAEPARSALAVCRRTCDVASPAPVPTRGWLLRVRRRSSTVGRQPRSVAPPVATPPATPRRRAGRTPRCPCRPRTPPKPAPRCRRTNGPAGRSSPTRFACRCCSGSTSSPKTRLRDRAERAAAADRRPGQRRNGGDDQRTRRRPPARLHRRGHRTRDREMARSGALARQSARGPRP